MLGHEERLEEPLVWSPLTCQLRDERIDALAREIRKLDERTEQALELQSAVGSLTDRLDNLGERLEHFALGQEQLRDRLYGLGWRVSAAIASSVLAAALIDRLW